MNRGVKRVIGGGYGSVPLCTVMDDLYWDEVSVLQTRLSLSEWNWLSDRGSLTKRLVSLCQGRFSLEILSEGDQALRRDECSVLGFSFPRREWVREVLLKGYDQPWVYARSILIAEGLQGYSRALRHIGSQPLGSVLFQRGLFSRTSLQLSVYPEEWLPLQYARAGLWARRSVFIGEKQRLLVQEIFLPDFWREVSGLKRLKG